MAAAAREALKIGGMPVETQTQISGIQAGPMGSDPDPDSVALDYTSTQSGWSTDAVDDSHFAIPAGYKKAETRAPGPTVKGTRPHVAAPQP
jgi:hypothetical protein